MRAAQDHLCGAPLMPTYIGPRASRSTKLVSALGTLVFAWLVLREAMCGSRQTMTKAAVSMW